ncbi:hypothetical protein ACWF94_12895 [Streptomyces sp. NPDC055078]
MARRGRAGRVLRNAGRGRTVTGQDLSDAILSYGGQRERLRIRGARVDGGLDLGLRRLDFELELIDCHFTGPLELRGLSVRTLDLTSSAFPALHGDRLVVGGDLRLTRARIGTGAGCAVPLVDPGGAGDRTRVTRRVEGHAEAPVRLPDARIEGNLIAHELAVHSDGQWSVYAPRLKVEASIQARDLTAPGALYLRDARVAHAFGLNGARVGGLDATGLACGRGLHADWGFRTTGQVLLRGAEVDTVVTFHDAVLEAPAGALILSRLATPRLRLDLREPPAGPVILRDARLGALIDAPASWPAPGNLDLEGLVYQRLGSTEPVGVKDRLRWLGRDPQVSAGSYEQLATSYEASGDERAARTVRHGREKRLRLSEGFTGRLWGGVQDALFGYGYAPRRALLWLVCLAGAGSAWFAGRTPPPAGRSGGRAWDPVLYSLDLLVPVASLGYRSAFDPVGADKAVAVFLILSGWLLATAVIAGARRAVRG